MVVQFVATLGLDTYDGNAMPILVRNVRLNLNEPESRLRDAVAQRLRVSPQAIRSFAPIRRSLDARRNDDMHFIYHVEVALDEPVEREQTRVRRLRSQSITIINPTQRHHPIPGTQALAHPPVIVGFGPAGMFAALRLAEFGFAPIVLERGMDVRTRHRDVLQKFYREHVFNPESNLLFGEGGAGTYSDGKLYTRLHDPLIETVLEWFYRHGADPEILTDARPHIGSDRLPTICRNMREHIERCGGQVRFGTRLDDVELRDGALAGITIGSERRNIGPLILAIGHSARDTMTMLHRRGVPMERRPFQIGVRVEHRQENVDRWQYGACAGHDRLPPAEYHVVAKNAYRNRDPASSVSTTAFAISNDCYSFCMCPGGMILPTNESAGLVATNGASKSSRGSPFANSGLVVTVFPPDSNDDPLSGIEFQRSMERRAFEIAGGDYRVPCQRAGDFLAGRRSDGTLQTSYPMGGSWVDIRGVIPHDVADALSNAFVQLDERMPGFAGPDAIVTAPETRVSSPVRIPRHPQLRTADNVDLLYPTGEGAGYAGGIISSAIDGIKTADAIIRRFAPVLK